MSNYLVTIRSKENSPVKKIRVHKCIWHFGCIHDMDQLKKFKETFEIELIKHSEKFDPITKENVEIFTLSKEIHDDYTGGFWKVGQVEYESKEKTLKKVKGLSNGSIVDCFISIDENEVRVHRPNPNAKEVYKRMLLKDEIEFRKTQWYI